MRQYAPELIGLWIMYQYTNISRRITCRITSLDIEYIITLRLFPNKINSILFLYYEELRNLKEFQDKGVNVSDNLAGILESVRQAEPKNEFLVEWWSKQKELQSIRSDYGRRYSPSIIR